MPDMTATVETLPILLVPDPILKARARPVGAGDMEQVRDAGAAHVRDHVPRAGHRPCRAAGRASDCASPWST